MFLTSHATISSMYKHIKSRYMHYSIDGETTVVPAVGLSALHMRQLNTFLRGDLNEFMEHFLVTTSVDMSITPLQPYSIYICAFPYTCKSI